MAKTKKLLLFSMMIIAALILGSCQDVPQPSQPQETAQAPAPEKPAPAPAAEKPAQTVSAAEKPAAPANGFDALNGKETRYAEYKDSASMLRRKLAQVDYINQSRKAHGAPPVTLDILASRVANRMSREACAANFMGHWNTRGEKPYQRYSAAGGRDHVSENAAASWSTASFDRSDGSYALLMRQAHDSFMAEVAPNDGHKRNCIDARHNYVGIGVDIEGGQFRYYEEFIDRYLEFQDVKTEIAVNQESVITVKPLRGGDIVYALLVYYEPLPVPMTPTQINRMGAYPDFSGTIAVEIWPWDLEKLKNGEFYRIPLKFAKPGSYYANIYVSDKPYSRSQASTEDKIQASGVVFTVK